MATLGWEIIADKLLFGITITYDIPELATTALSEGSDSPSLRILAGLNSMDRSEEIERHFKKCLHEFGIAEPRKEEAAWRLLRYYTDLILHREIDLYQGLDCIFQKIYNNMHWANSNNVYVGDSVGLEALYGFYDNLGELLSWQSPLYHGLPKGQVLEDLSSMLYQEIAAYKRTHLSFD